MNYSIKLYAKIFFEFLFFSFVCVCIYYFVRAEDNIYYWDFKEYYVKFFYLSNLFHTNIYLLIDQCRSSIADDDYNLSSVILPSLFSPLGTNRLNYIYYIYILYCIPSVVFISKLLSKNKSIFYCAFIFATVVLYTPFLAPILRGYPDICGILPFIIFLLYFFNSDIHTRINFKSMIMIGAILYIPFLFRRWYIYNIFSFYTSFFVVNILWHRKKHYIINIICNIAISGITTLLLMFAFQYFLLLRIIETDYTYNYSAYSGTLLTSITNICDRFPLIFLLMFFVSCIFLIAKKDKLGIFCLMSIIILISTFIKMQDFDVHHFLPVSMLFIIILLWQIYYIKSEKIALFVLFFVSIISFVNFQSTFFNKYTVPFVTQKYKLLPLKHNNYCSLLNLCNKIISLNSVKYAKISFFSSSDILNESMIETIIGNGIIRNTSQVDRRDGIAIDSLFSQYVIITDNSQTHLGGNNQRVITIPNEKIFNHIGIGKSYKRLSGPYALSNNCSAYIYEKIKTFDNDEISDYLSSFPEDKINWPNKPSRQNIIELEKILYK